MPDVELDQERLDAFSGQLVDTLNEAAVGLMLSIAHRTGLFDTMSRLPPSTSHQIAVAAGCRSGTCGSGSGRSSPAASWITTRTPGSTACRRSMPPS